MQGAIVIDEKELADFKEWQRSKHQTQLDAAFYDLADMMDNMKGYTITMPANAFKTIARALILLHEEVMK